MVLDYEDLASVAADEVVRAITKQQVRERMVFDRLTLILVHVVLKLVHAEPPRFARFDLLWRQPTDDSFGRDTFDALPQGLARFEIDGSDAAQVSVQGLASDDERHRSQDRCPVLIEQVLHDPTDATPHRVTGRHRNRPQRRE